MMDIDPNTCATLVVAMADRLAAEAPRAAQDAPVTALVAQVRQVSGAAQKSLRHALADLYPTIGWNAEEAQPSATDNPFWQFDPIDGAYHYLQGLPLWSSSLALVQGGRVLFSVVYDPGGHETYLAIAGGGATLNGERLRVSAKTELTAAVLGSALPPLAQVGPVEHGQALTLLGAVSREVFVVRPMAAASLQLAYVAAGRLDGYWETGRDWADWLAGLLLVQEAGGVVTDLRGAAFGGTGDGVLAANSQLHAALRPVLAQPA